MSRLLWPLHALSLFLALMRDMIVSSIQVAWAVLAPKDATAPRFLTVPMKAARSDLEITMVGNYITLTPGTLTVDADPEQRTLLVHSLFAGDTGDSVRADVQDGIEPRVMRVTRP